LSQLGLVASLITDWCSGAGATAFRNLFFLSLIVCLFEKIAWTAYHKDKMHKNVQTNKDLRRIMLQILLSSDIQTEIEKTFGYV
jgi:hypothetical protein